MRAAAPLLYYDENVPSNDDAASTIGPGQPVVFTTLHSAVAPAASGRDAQSSVAPQAWMDARGVAMAFITNLSGGAACYDVDLGLIAADALNEDLTQAFSEMRRLMTFADAAAWSVTDVATSTAAVLATATTGIGDESSAEMQIFTLHINAAASKCPIVRVVAHERINTSACAEADEEEL